MFSFAALRADVERAMLRDRFRLRRQLQTLAKTQSDRPAEAARFQRELDRFLEALSQSLDLAERRRRAVPRVAYDDSLPVSTRREEIAAAIAKHPVVIVCGETGSGKSTQLPKICLELGRGVTGVIGHTQPRRLAARSVAARVAEELRTPLGQGVGFKIRFSDATKPETHVKVMTDGVLLAETRSDRFLDQYDTLIIDEAHERSLNIDFLLGYLTRLIPKRPELRVVITSATIDVARFSEHFAFDGQPAPVIEVAGRTFPVETRYRPLEVEADAESDPDTQRGVQEALAELFAEGPGDVLVFLPTEREIRETAKNLRGWLTAAAGGDRVEILPLYARLSINDQNRVFQPHGKRRVVLATNVAESSLTVPGIHYVVDVGTARVSRYSPRSKVQRLPIEAISRASADQRQGRCGRVGPGVCVRLYSEDDYLSRERFTAPEIRRANLASVVLQAKALNLGPLDDFPFLDPPRPEALRDGHKTLFEIGACDENDELTEIGHKLSHLPVDPRIGRMILASRDERCLHEVLIIASALELQDPRERPPEQRQAADERHARFLDPNSDFLSFLKLWDFYHQLKSDLTRGQLERALRQNFLSYQRLREWVDVNLQLQELVEEQGYKVPHRRGEVDYAALHRALLTGLLSNIALKGDEHEYTGAGGQKLHLWPGSGVFASKPRWIVAAELVETSRRYARTAAKIEPEWLEPLAPHLLHYSYSEPRWQRATATTLASEKVSLFGLPIVLQRAVRYGPIDPATSRRVFIEHALALGEIDLKAPFLRHNERVAAQIAELGAKTRRRDLIVDDHARVAFFESRVPADVYDGATLQKWRQAGGKAVDDLLCLGLDDLLPQGPPPASDADYPAALEARGTRFPLQYRFEPGADDDGLTIVTPKEGLNQLHPERLEWLIPGWLEEKVVALIRSLPKELRRAFVPAPDFARKALAHLKFAEGPFLTSVADALRRAGGERLTPGDFRLDELPPHLRARVRVIDGDGKTLAAGRDLHALRAKLGLGAVENVRVGDDDRWRRQGLTAWNFGDLPPRLEIRRGGVTLPAFPALLDQGDSVALTLLDNEAEAAAKTRAGARRLFCLAAKKELKAQTAWLPNLNQLKLYAARLPKRERLEEQLADLIADRALYAGRALGADQAPPRTAADFEKRCKAGRLAIPSAVQEVGQVVAPLLEAYHQVRVRLEAPAPPQGKAAVEDIQSQLARLASPDFFTNTPWEWLARCPRFLKAMLVRLDKLGRGGATRDQQLLARLQPYLDRWRQGEADPRLPRGADFELYRWMLEEFRVSLFAQELGTSQPVSEKRLDKLWEKATEVR